MNIAFFLKRGKKIMFRVTDSGDRFVKSTGLEVSSPTDWDANRQRVKGISKRSRATNSKLQLIEDDFFDFVYSKDNLTLEEVKYQYLNGGVKSDSEKVEDFDLNIITRSYLKGLKSGEILKKTGERASQRTIFTYDSTRNFVESFTEKHGVFNIKVVSKKDILSQRRDIELISSKIKSFSVDAGYLNSTTALRILHIKQIINYYVKRHNLSLDLEEVRRCFKYPTEDNAVEILEPELFFKVVEVLSECRDYQDDDAIRAGMDFIIIASKTGARISDILSWTKSENFTDGKKLRYRQKKKRGYSDIVIPVDKVTAHIFNANHERYGSLMAPFSTTSIRAKMHDILGMFDELVESFRRIRYIEQKKVVKTGERRDFVTAHTFRASLASVMLMKGVDRKTVMKITGHSPNSAAFARYENVSENHKEEAYMDFWDK